MADLENAANAQTGKSAAIGAIKAQFEGSGNMERMFGANQQTDVAQGNALIAQDLAAQQDLAHRGTSPQAELQPQAAPPVTQQLNPQGQQQPEQQVTPPQAGEEMVSKQVFLGRLNQEIGKRKELEAQIQSLQGNQVQQTPAQAPAQAQPPQAAPPLDPDDPQSAVLMQVVEGMNQLGQVVAGMQQQQQQSALATHFSGNHELATLVNEVYRDGASGISMDEAFSITQARNPELFSGNAQGGQGGPVPNLERAAPSPDNRMMPNQGQQSQANAFNQLVNAGTQTDRKAAGVDLLKQRLFN